MHLPQTGNFWWLHDYGDSVVPMLHAIRRRGPGTARRGALLALVHLRGEAELDAEDLDVLRRLIQIKVARDVPYALDACFNSWLTVQGGDQRGIMRVLGLTDAAPATYPLGETLVCHLSHLGPDQREDCAHVFISPQLNGWTVVRGSVRTWRPSAGFQMKTNRLSTGEAVYTAGVAGHQDGLAEIRAARRRAALCAGGVVGSPAGVRERHDSAGRDEPS